LNPAELGLNAQSPMILDVDRGGIRIWLIGCYGT
jgi:hypothetical protein